MFRFLLHKENRRPELNGMSIAEDNSLSRSLACLCVYSLCNVFARFIFYFPFFSDSGAVTKPDSVGFKVTNIFGSECAARGTCLGPSPKYVQL